METMLAVRGQPQYGRDRFDESPRALVKDGSREVDRLDTIRSRGYAHRSASKFDSGNDGRVPRPSRAWTKRSIAIRHNKSDARALRGGFRNRSPQAFLTRRSSTRRLHIITCDGSDRCLTSATCPLAFSLR